MTYPPAVASGVVRLTIRSVLLALVTVSATVVPSGPAVAASVLVVDADGAASTSSCDAADAAPRTITAALASVDAGGTIRVCPGTVVEAGQVVVGRDVTVRAFDPAVPPTISPAADTGTVGDDRGWWLVRPGVTLSLRDLHLDGTRRRIHQGVRFRGQGDVRDVVFTDIAYNAAGPDRSGFAVVAFGDGPVTVADSRFRRIGRVGALFFGPDTSGSRFARNSYVGKGDGTHLDYGVEIGDGSRVRVEDSAISHARGQVDGTVSAGVLISTAFGGGAGLTLTGSRLSDNANGVFIDDEAGRGLGQIAIARNGFVRNGVLGVTRSGGASIDATCNWWGASDGPRTLGGSGDGIAAGVTAEPFLTSSDLDGRCAGEPLVVAEAVGVTVNEGATASMAGTFEAGTSADVELSASTGAITTTGGNRGTWSWTARPEDGPADSATVTVTADNGSRTTTSFGLTVRNVDPTASFDAPGTAFTDRPFELSLRNVTDASPVDRAAGLVIAFDCGDGLGFGPTGTATEVACSIDRGGRRTVRAAVADKDGGRREFSSVVAVYHPDGDGAPDRSASGTVAPLGSVSTGTGEATPWDPIVTRVRVPSGGEVTIEEGPPTGTAPVDHALATWGAVVTAPVQTATAPLEITLRLDADLFPPPVPGLGEPEAVPVRDGVIIPPCDDDADLPCVDRRWTIGDDLLLLVRTTTAGAFDLAFPTVACPAVGLPPTAFTDVAGTAHGTAIACAERWDLVRGVGSGTYAPAGAVTRAQVATMIARLLALAGTELAAEPADRFTDDDGSVHELAISQLAELRVMEGRTATTFAPAAPLTRAQFASTLARAASVLRGSPLPAGSDRFLDDDGIVHEDNIDAVAAAGLANGVSEDRFDPHGTVRRDQTASFLTRLFGAWYVDHRG